MDELERDSFDFTAVALSYNYGDRTNEWNTNRHTRTLLEQKKQSFFQVGSLNYLQTKIVSAYSYFRCIKLIFTSELGRL